jgi:ribose transport system permease protein
MKLQPSFKSFFMKARSYLIPIGVLLVVVAVFSIANPIFISPGNIKNIASRSAVPAVLAVGMTFVIMIGSIDLSVEGIMAASSLVLGTLVLNNRTGHDLGWWGLVIALGMALIFGLVNGIIHAYFRLPSFMVTLGTWFIGLGVAMLLSSGEPPWILDESIRSWGLGDVQGIPTLAFTAIFCVLLGWFIEKYTVFGRYTRAIGGDESIAKQSGINIPFWKAAAFAFAGVMFGLGGIMESAKIGIGHSQIGLGRMFEAITAVVLGGTLLSGGYGGVIQSFIGVLILSVLKSGMVFAGISTQGQEAVQGLLLLGTVLITSWSKKGTTKVIK